ncbi:MAG: hypothetical protein ACOVOG_02500 [Rubrivivax sp.]
MAPFQEIDMSGSACVLWWLVLGIVLGWLASWLIGRMLRTEMPATKVVETIVERPVERIVEKIVEVPVERIIETVVERPIEKIIDRPVDNPALLAQVASLSTAAALVPTLRAQLASAEAAVASLRAAQWPVVNIAAAKAAGFLITGDDDLKVVEGIGPKIEQLLHGAGIRRFSELAQVPVQRLREVLDAAGPHYRITDPSTWPEQGLLCARNNWVELKALQDSLTAGRR